MGTDDHLRELGSALEPLRARVRFHPLHARLRDRASIARFMEFHVFAVWDFMSLLKALQRALTSVELPWRPVGTARTRRFVNELVLEEESDEIDGVATGHFELYRRAMLEAGAATARIDRLVALVGAGLDLHAALDVAEVPEASARFVRATFASIDPVRPHVTASVFTFGREDAIPAMFGAIAAAVPGDGGSLHLLRLYLDRHIALDGEQHGPKAMRLIAELCEDDPTRWAEAKRAAAGALAARIALWDAIALALGAPVHVG